MAYLLWIAILIPAAFVGIGIFFYIFGDRNLPYRGTSLRQIAGRFLEHTIAGFQYSAPFCIVFGPLLVLYYAAHLSFTESAGIGLPLGMLLLVWFSRFIPKSTAVSKTTDLGEH